MVLPLLNSLCSEVLKFSLQNVSLLGPFLIVFSGAHLYAAYQLEGSEPSLFFLVVPPFITEKPFYF